MKQWWKREFLTFYCSPIKRNFSSLVAKFQLRTFIKLVALRRTIYAVNELVCIKKFVPIIYCCDFYNIRDVGITTAFYVRRSDT